MKTFTKVGEQIKMFKIMHMTYINYELRDSKMLLLCEVKYYRYIKISECWR